MGSPWRRRPRGQLPGDRLAGPSWLGLGGTAGGLAVFVLYVVLIRREGNDSFGDVAPFAGAMLGATILAAIGSLTGRRILRRRLLAAAAAPLLVLAVLASMSIGILLVPPGLALAIASSGAARPRAEG